MDLISQKLFNYLTMDIKQFISDFDFTDPDFGDLPQGFPKLSKKGLTKEEGHLIALKQWGVL